MFFVQKIWNLLTDSQQQMGTELERYIISKNPKTVSDVEYWQHRYMLEQQHLYP